MNTDEVLAFNARNITEFRASGGKIKSFGDAPLLLLTTVGVTSGAARTSPMMYLPDEHEPDVVYVFASAAGADRNPAWWGNLTAHPDDVTVEIGRERLTAHAHVLAEPERQRIFDIQASRYAGFAGYQRMTSRPIPVAALTLQPPA